MSAAAPFVDGVADALLFIAALFVTFRALNGARLEKQAERMDAGGKRDSKIADAKTYYAAASLTRPWVLWFVFLGTAAKAVLAVLGWLEIIP